MRSSLTMLALVSVLLNASVVLSQVKEDQIKDSLRRATQGMVAHVAVHGGYAWVSSRDGTLSHGEGVAGPERVWVQPPGTPAVGDAFLDAYLSTGDPVHLEAAQKVGHALITGQLASGGWGYSIEFDPQTRQSIPYRIDLSNQPEQLRQLAGESGWHVWRQRKHKENLTIVDDDTTPAAVRFLMRLDKQQEFKDEALHQSVQYALTSLLGAQYPIGAYAHNYDRFPFSPPSTSKYPVLQAHYPETWSRTWDRAFSGCYFLNDRITLNVIDTWILASQIYNDPRYRDAAIRGGEFLLHAQLPMPQPAWAQQYSSEMLPVWDRPFEPPAITSEESQDTLETLMDLYAWSRDKRFLEPIPRAISYLKTCLLADGRLARFYELKTNRPLYFNTQYELTYEAKDMPDHYGFVRESRLNEIEKRYHLLASGTPDSAMEAVRPSAKDVEKIIQSQAESGLWLTPGFVRDADGQKVIPPEGVVDSSVFIRNVSALCEAIKP